MPCLLKIKKAREGFPYACRSNHAYDNNAQKIWKANIRRHTAHAMRDIHKGEEIAIYYYCVDENLKNGRRLFSKDCDIVFMPSLFISPKQS